MARASFEAAATLVGCTIGAGILGIPYVVAQAGFITGAITIILLGALMLMLNLFTGEIALRTEGDHQLPGYAERYLGKHGKRIMTAAMIFAIYGAILAYLIKSGEILSMLFGGSEFVHSIFFFSAIAFLIYLGPAIVRKSL
jgi:tyrosine-specific transport protein